MEQHEIARRLDGVAPGSPQEMAVLMTQRADMARLRGLDYRELGMAAGAAANEAAAIAAAEGMISEPPTGQQAARIAIEHTPEATPSA